jgi:4-hydroxy-2-oxoheptanedioate aldolase
MRIKERLAAGKIVRTFLVGQFCDPKLIEMLGISGGWDAVWLDQEHAGLSVRQIEEAARAARGIGLDSFVRLIPTDYATVMRAMEAGAGGVMAAQVKSAHQAEEIVSWAKFHPRGDRGINGTGVDNHYGKLPLVDYLKKANAESFVSIQIENPEAVEQVEQIAAVKDVDVLCVGMADLSQSMGIPGQYEHPRVQEAVERIAQAAAKNGIDWAILPTSPAHAEQCLKMGCRMLVIGIDVRMIQRGLRSFMDEYGQQLATA